MNAPLSKVCTGAYAGSHIGNTKAMRKSRSKSGIPPKPDWATTIFELRQRLNLSQTALGQRLHCTAMSVSRWERGTREPPAGTISSLEISRALLFVGILGVEPACGAKISCVSCLNSRHDSARPTMSRLRHFDHTEVLQPENREYESIVLDDKHKWKILAKVLWWIGKAP
jgi:DNA-binding transcriptional regulator YiaG